MEYDPWDDLYSRLGLTPATASPEAIRAARRSKLKEIHPDRGEDDGGDEEASKRITEAASILLDPVQSKRYLEARNAYWAPIFRATKKVSAASKAAAKPRAKPVTVAPRKTRRQQEAETVVEWAGLGYRFGEWLAKNS